MTIESGALKIIQILREAGCIAYYAGGWVRDFLLGYPSDDIDIATDANPQKIVELFPRTIQVGISFGVVVVLMDGHQYEVATFREDLGYEDGRRPVQCSYTDAQGDASRRDFTINGMFYDPLKKEVIDFVGGQADLERKIVRAIGAAQQRFREDRLRMVRAIRFTYRFDYTLDPQTEQAIRDHAHTLFPAVAMERIWQELRKMARYASFGQALLKMHAVGLLTEIFPRLKEASDLPKRVEVIERFPAGCPAILQVMELFPHASLPELIAQCDYLKVSNKEVKLVEYTDRVRRQTGSDDADWVPLYAHPEAEMVLQVVCAREGGGAMEDHRRRIERLRAHIERAARKTPVVTAAMLSEQGVMPGKRMGLLLKEAEKLAIRHDLHRPEEVMARLKNQAVWEN